MDSSNINRFNEILKILKESDLKSGITPDKLCITIEKLGPTFIKIGQIISTRVDIIPKEYCDALGKLRSEVTPLAFEEIERILKENYDDVDEIFSSIEEESLAAASIAQVHLARLKKGKEKVVIKIKRPGIEEMLEQDIKLLKKAINTLHLNKIIKVMDLNDVIDQIYEVTKEEANFLIEANHLMEFRHNHKEYDNITCPYVYKNLSTENVIVMSYINGIKINDIEKLQSNNYDLNAIADLLSKNYIKQALSDGFFHADPHPDNILIKNDNIVYIDLGMMGRLSDKNKKLLKKCIKKIIIEDYKSVSEILISMSTQIGEVDYINLENNVRQILEEFGGLELESISASKFITDMFNMLKNNNLVLDKDVTMLIRGIGIIEPVLKNLNPKISLLKVLILSEKEDANLLSKDNLKIVKQKMIKSVNGVVDIPIELHTLLKSLNKGESKFKVELSNSKNHVDKLENLVHELVMGFLDGCLLIATVLTEDYKLKNIFATFALALAVWLIVKMIKDLLHRGY